MKIIKSGWVVALFGAAILCLCGLNVRGQEPAEGEAKAEPAASAASDRFELESKDMTADAPVVKGIESKKKLTHRLPNNYGKVISAKQKQEIYDIQDKYLPLIELLTARLELLKEEMNAKVKAVLTEEQKNEVENAASKRGKAKE